MTYMFSFHRCSEIESRTFYAQYSQTE